MYESYVVFAFVVGVLFGMRVGWNMREHHQEKLDEIHGNEDTPGSLVNSPDD